MLRDFYHFPPSILLIIKKNIKLDIFNTDVVESIGIDKTFNFRNYGDFAGANIDIVSKEDLMDYEKFYLLRFEQQALTWQKEDEKKLLEEYQTLKNKINIKQISEELEEYLAQYYFRIQKYEKSFQLMANFLPQNNVC